MSEQSAHELDMRQTTADIERTRADTDRLTAEAAKIRSETRMYPWVVIAGLFGAAAAVGKLLATT